MLKIVHPVQLLIDPLPQPLLLPLQPFEQLQLKLWSIYIIDVLLPTQLENGLNTSNNKPIHHILPSNPLHLLNQTLKIPQTILTTLNLVNDRYNPCPCPA